MHFFVPSDGVDGVPTITLKLACVIPPPDSETELGSVGVGADLREGGSIFLLHVYGPTWWLHPLSSNDIINSLSANPDGDFARDLPPDSSCRRHHRCTALPLVSGRGGS